MTLTTLVTGATAAAREAAIVSIAERQITTALLLEGLPNGSSPLDTLAASGFHIARIAPGCLCCTGNLTMRVTLNRILRQAPDRLYIGLATDFHLERIRALLTAPPYDNFLQMTKDLHA